MANVVREGRGWVPQSAADEGMRVSKLLADEIRDAGLSVRAVEQRLGWGTGTLWQVLVGSQPIRISHIAAVCEALAVSPREFYRKMSEEGEDKRPGRKRPDPGKRPRPTSVPDLEPSDLEMFRKFRRWLRQEEKGKKKDEGPGDE